MARYIDADALLKNINTNPAEAHNERCAQILEAILYAPTVDVAPRAEVAREIFEEIEKTVNACVVDESLFKPAYFEYRKFNEHLADLKKKYTEEN